MARPMKMPRELPARPVRDLINRQCFISYSWDSSHHKDWVRQLANRLVGDGIPTSLDQWDLTPGMDVPNYVETRIRESEFVLLVCTPSFARKADSIRGGVGYEKTILTGEILQGIGTDKQLIPIIRSGTPKKSLPSYLKSKYFIDFRQDPEFENAFDELLRSIAKAPRYVRPELGTIPSLRPIEFTVPNKKLSKTISPAANKSKSSHSLPTKKVFKPRRDKHNYTKSVFLNCPNSDDYSPLLRAIVFTVTILGFKARSPLEINAGSARFQKLYTLISGCKYGIHDVSQPKRKV